MICILIFACVLLRQVYFKLTLIQLHLGWKRGLLMALIGSLFSIMVFCGWEFVLGFAHLGHFAHCVGGEICNHGVGWVSFARKKKTDTVSLPIQITLLALHCIWLRNWYGNSLTTTQLIYGPLELFCMLNLIDCTLELFIAKVVGLDAW
ncbi:hypothetical protein CFP56_039471 [Quercus suber]|uniref:Uncharacterized protein n=1 Tax=Quercus suber TaxID=58331 RepID=A0AAW0IYZ6_QUESU